MSGSEQRRFALADYSVERRERGWYFGRQFDPAGAYRGPYGSTASVTLSIARELRREIERRDRLAARDGQVSTANLQSS
jgi:hypothetical protein